MSARHPGADRLPPQSRDAERCVLGSMLRDNSVIADVVQIVRARELLLRRPPENLPGASSTSTTTATRSTWSSSPSKLNAAASCSRTSAATPISPNSGTPPRPPPTPSTTPRSSATRRIVRNLIHASTEILRDAYDRSQPADELLGGGRAQDPRHRREGHHRQHLHPARGHCTTPTTASTRASKGGHADISGMPTGYRRSRRAHRRACRTPS